MIDDPHPLSLTAPQTRGQKYNESKTNPKTKLDPIPCKRKINDRTSQPNTKQNQRRGNRCSCSNNSSVRRKRQA